MLHSRPLNLYIGTQGLPCACPYTLCVCLDFSKLFHAASRRACQAAWPDRYVFAGACIGIGQCGSSRYLKRKISWSSVCRASFHAVVDCWSRALLSYAHTVCPNKSKTPNSLSTRAGSRTRTLKALPRVTRVWINKPCFSLSSCERRRPCRG